MPNITLVLAALTLNGYTPAAPCEPEHPTSMLYQLLTRDVGMQVTSLHTLVDGATLSTFEGPRNVAVIYTESSGYKSCFVSEAEKRQAP